VQIFFVFTLKDAWVNEKFAPELLEPQAEIVDCLIEQLSRTEEHISTLDKGHFGIALHKMELQRIRFLVSFVISSVSTLTFKDIFGSLKFFC
jgi:GINS complex subunit 4